MLPLLVVLAQGPQGPQTPHTPILLRPGIVITHSGVVVRRTYRDVTPVIVRGNNITLDFAGATLQGGAADTGIRIEGGTNVKILNARIRGYKVGILARGTHHLTLLDNDLSYNWKPRLYSLVEHESLADWLSFHHNEHDEWLRYGAAIYLADVVGGDIRENGAVGGMNGLLLVRTTGVSIKGNNFSFNSGLGVGLYRSSDDTIVHNWIDFNVRGYSNGFYSRGQDSADLLVYEQSDSNVIAYNSLTHGGDGVFLWAGQTTMDSGLGGANDNWIYGNDVSYATANGVEATFSRNAIIGNRAWGGEYGVWGGYSHDTKIIGNDFRWNRVGVAIEHGQNNTISGDRFAHDTTAIQLWADSIAPSDWGYPRHHDTQSHDYEIAHNVFVGNRAVLDARNTTGVSAVDSAPGDTVLPPLPPLPRVARQRIPVSDLARRDRSAIIVDEWGPYDWNSPKLWPVDSTRANPLRLAVLGPPGPGRWRLLGSHGVRAVSRDNGRVPDTIAVTASPDSLGDWGVTLEYVGAATLSPNGATARAGKPYHFSYERFESPLRWDVRFFRWKDSTNLFETPVDSALATLPRLDVMRYDRPGKDHWSLRASGSVSLPAGDYTLRTISDDAIRVYVDDALVIDDWARHESTVDTAALAGGKHQLRVEYAQVDGWVELRVEIVRAPVATGPAGTR